MAVGAALQLAALSAPALAADDRSGAAADKGGLEEIVVTAQFVKQNLQTTPISITAVTGDMLEQRSITNIVDVANATPNLLMREGSSGSGMSNAAYIRGIGQGDFLFAYSPKVSFYIDDVYFSTVYGSVFDLMDIDRVEVDRGPQGTLFGRNAVGGAIRIFSKEPRGDNSGYIEATGGTYGRMDVKGSADLSLVDNLLSARVSMMTHKQDGWVDLLNFACAHPGVSGLLPNTGTNTQNGCKVGTLGAVDTQAFRVSLRWTPNEHFDNVFSFDYTKDSDTASPDTLTAPYQYDTLDRSPGAVNGFGASATTPNGLGVWLKSVGGPAYGLPLGAAVGANGALPSPALLAALAPTNPYVSYASFGNPGLSRPGAGFADPNVNDLTSLGYSDKINWRIADNLTLKSVTAYRSYQGTFGSSQDSMPFPTQEAFQGVEHRQFSEELSLSGTLWNKLLDWTAGAFYLDTRELNTGRVQFEGFAFFGNAFVQDFLIDDPATLKNESAFVHTVWHLTDKLNLTAGVRESHETKTYNFFREYSFLFGPVPTPIPACQSALGPACPDIPLLGNSNSIHRTNPRLALDYQLQPDLLVYTSYSTGFTAGGINGRPFRPQDIIGYGPEDVKAYELGVKSTFLDNTLRVNAAVYYTKYDNIQVTLSCTTGCADPGTPFYVGNGGNARIEGWELETEYRPFGGLLITATAGQTDFKYTYLNPDVSGLTTNSPQTNVPKFNASLGIQNEFHLGNLGSLTPRVDANYRSTIYFNPQNPQDPLSKQQGYALVNARLTWRAMDPTWQASLAVTNLTDKLYYVAKSNGLTGFGSATGTVGAPRMWTLSLKRSF